MKEVTNTSRIIELVHLKEYFGYTSRWMILIPFAIIAIIAHMLTFYIERPLMRWLRT